MSHLPAQAHHLANAERTVRWRWHPIARQHFAAHLHREIWTMSCVCLATQSMPIVQSYQQWSGNLHNKELRRVWGLSSETARYMICSWAQTKVRIIILISFMSFYNKHSVRTSRSLPAYTFTASSVHRYVHYLIIAPQSIRRLSKRPDLKEQNTKAPHIAGRRVTSVVNCLAKRRKWIHVQPKYLYYYGHSPQRVRLH